MSDVNELFYSLLPERILSAVESLGLRCTGRLQALNSLENRVIQAELEEPTNKDDRFSSYRVAKFYRPGRWRREQIIEEHRFMLELEEAGLPVVPPLVLPEGSSLGMLDAESIFFCLWPRIGGRTLDELSDRQLEKLGRLIARLHLVGKRTDAVHRRRLDGRTYGLESLEILEARGSLPEMLRERFAAVVKEICRISGDLLRSAQYQRVHGDLHGGNVLWDGEDCRIVDFDDMVMAPCVQDLWLIVPGRDEDSLRRRDRLLRGYEEMRRFDRRELRLIEPLRSLRIIHYAAWIAKRWEDPAFKGAFPNFGTLEYWRDQLITLEEQLQLVRQASYGEG